MSLQKILRLAALALMGAVALAQAPADGKKAPASPDFNSLQEMLKLKLSKMRKLHQDGAAKADQKQLVKEYKAAQRDWNIAINAEAQKNGDLMADPLTFTFIFGTRYSNLYRPLGTTPDDGYFGLKGFAEFVGEQRFDSVWSWLDWLGVSRIYLAGEVTVQGKKQSAYSSNSSAALETRLNAAVAASDGVTAKISIMPRLMRSFGNNVELLGVAACQFESYSATEPNPPIVGAGPAYHYTELDQVKTRSELGLILRTPTGGKAGSLFEVAHLVDPLYPESPSRLFLRAKGFITMLKFKPNGNPVDMKLYLEGTMNKSWKQNSQGKDETTISIGVPVTF